MKGNRLGRVLKIAPFALLMFALFVFVVMQLWNWLMPALFGLKVITYWQALGLLVLSKILFGGFRGGHGRGWGGGGGWRHRMRERWEQMSPEERERFRQGMHDRWGHGTPPTQSA
jgi:hypothetical protein